MESRHDDLGRGSILGGVLIDGNPTTIVRDSDAVVLMNDDGDFAAVSRYGFINRVVDNLIDEMMKAIGPGRPDIHCRALANRIQAFQDLDRTSVVTHARDTPKGQNGE